MLPKLERELQHDVEYIEFKREQALNKFIKSIHNDKDPDYIAEKYNQLLRIHKQTLLIEDALLIYNVVSDETKSSTSK